MDPQPQKVRDAQGSPLSQKGVESMGMKSLFCIQNFLFFHPLLGNNTNPEEPSDVLSLDGS